MFYNFKKGSAETSSKESKSDTSNARRRPSTIHACEPCRRRKVRRSGDMPCESCRWHRKPAQCQYGEHNQRTTPSKRPIEKATSSLIQQYQSVFQKLFPEILPSQLAEFSREDLVDLIIRNSPRTALQPPTPLPLSLTDELGQSADPDACYLETFQPMPADESEISDEPSNRALLGVQDDVNALSLAVKPTVSYLGISSVMAILRVIVWLDPQAQAVFRRTPDVSTVPSRDETLPPTPPGVTDLNMEQDNDDKSRSAWDEIPQINTYFDFFHPVVPLLDEQSFRDTYITHRRSDSRWLLLLNVVLALGSAVSGTVHDTRHRLYYARARQYLTPETLGLAHIETVQALGLLGGYYLHYLQLPNQANSLMGTTLRLATALGLHRDYPEAVSPTRKEKTELSIELRRRVWWCTVCLDAWASATLGRPSMGRFNPSITAKAPQLPIGKSMQMLVLLQENIRFAAISTRAEDALAVSPIINEVERTALDTAYMEWFKVSSVLEVTPKQTSTIDAIGILVLKNIMRWKYLWHRLVLHRPVLLWYAMRRTPFEKLSEDRQTTIKLCWDLTADLISDVAKTWAGRTRCIMSGWHATWVLYQAAMVPLLTLFLDSVDPVVLEASHAQVEMAMQALSDQISYAHTAKRSLEVVSLVYEASKKYRSRRDRATDTFAGPDVSSSASTRLSGAQQQRPTFMDISTAGQFNLASRLDTPQQEMIIDNMFDSLNWNTTWIGATEDFGEFSNLGFNFNYMDLEEQHGNQYQTTSSFQQNF